MNHFPSPQPEQQLLSEMKRAEALYRRALAAIQTSLPQGDGTFEEISLCLVRIQPMMEQAQQLEKQLAPLRQAWLKFKQRPGAEMGKSLKQHEELLKTLIEKIDSLERSLQQQKTAAIPAVDSFIKHQQMQKAYQQISR